jgi:hypothetical protein
VRLPAGEADPGSREQFRFRLAAKMAAPVCACGAAWSRESGLKCWRRREQIRARGLAGSRAWPATRPCRPMHSRDNRRRASPFAGILLLANHIANLGLETRTGYLGRALVETGDPPGPAALATPIRAAEVASTDYLAQPARRVSFRVVERILDCSRSPMLIPAEGRLLSALRRYMFETELEMFMAGLS